ncbi:MAG: 2-amino-4-hydroxy-6-hydroxymethyldihydropteridine diphosphokinase [Myxococcota bacterium]|nr:2-amino-4-hydroxy-6-hydroxymethyldihydropteridine diphosphokinase [Myxococcota bacterium]
MGEHLLQEPVWVGIGSNLSEPIKQVKRACGSIQSLSTRALLRSPLYRSEPWGLKEQPAFINCVIGLWPRMESPEMLLLELQKIEASQGRERALHWGPRTIDLDLLYWPNEQRSSPRLTLPHPELANRRFVLEPWAALAPLLTPLEDGRTLEALLKLCPDSGGVEQLWDESSQRDRNTLARSSPEESTL